MQNRTKNTDQCKIKRFFVTLKIQNIFSLSLKFKDALNKNIFTTHFVLGKTKTK